MSDNQTDDMSFADSVTIDLQNHVSELNAATDLAQFEDRKEAYRAAVAECDTDIQHCVQQVRLWTERMNRTKRRRAHMQNMYEVLRNAKRALQDALERNGEKP